MEAEGMPLVMGPLLLCKAVMFGIVIQRLVGTDVPKEAQGS